MKKDQRAHVNDNGSSKPPKNDRISLLRVAGLNIPKIPQECCTIEPHFIAAWYELALLVIVD